MEGLPKSLSPLEKDKSSLGEDKLSQLFSLGHSVGSVLNKEDELSQTLKKIMVQVLDERETDVLKMRYGLDEYDYKKHSREEVGKKYGITKGYVRIIEDKSVTKLVKRISLLNKI